MRIRHFLERLEQLYTFCLASALSTPPMLALYSFTLSGHSTLTLLPSFFFLLTVVFWCGSVMVLRKFTCFLSCQAKHSTFPTFTDLVCPRSWLTFLSCLEKCRLLARVVAIIPVWWISSSSANSTELKKLSKYRWYPLPKRSCARSSTTFDPRLLTVFPSAPM